jgi:hypothetical protein
MEEKIVEFSQGLDIEPNELELFMDTIFDSSKSYQENKELLIKFILSKFVEYELRRS